VGQQNGPLLTPETLDYGIVPPGMMKTMSFTIANTGGTPLVINKSKPPSQGVFVAQTMLAEGSAIAPGTMVTETVAMSPVGSGAYTDQWIITGSDSSGVQMVTFSGETSADAGVAAGGDGGTAASGSTTGTAGTAGTGGVNGSGSSGAGSSGTGGDMSPASQGGGCSMSAAARSERWGFAFGLGLAAVAATRRRRSRRGA
jgi:hypothetical protein